jgi:hypothetical protein
MRFMRTIILQIGRVCSGAFCQLVQERFVLDLEQVRVEQLADAEDDLDDRQEGHHEARIERPGSPPGQGRAQGSREW